MNRPLSDEEFKQLALTGELILPAGRDNVAIHEYLTKVRGWRNVWTLVAPPEDPGGAHVKINARFD